MKRVAQISYAVAGACFAATLTMATTPVWWDEHSGIAVMLGLSMPLCIVGAWLSEFRIEPRSIFGFHIISHSPQAMAIAAWCGIGLGMITLTFFLFSISTHLALGFIIGFGVLSIFTGIQEVVVTESESPE
ncbi:hypothetical protein [Marinobacter sp. 1_MG-2023]|uniref:hypothetical protein n=1 Tax=Marinobacter sp. 1_MG-2023 TaxID=3062627 RepID=UPI0026E3AD94|nr:hypothetical protein [Marinobacter sp. 1_MG-2023]MDO6822117.1 hypothetical protein [Marinobacter sp. 1_MG-2023]